MVNPKSSDTKAAVQELDPVPDYIASRLALWDKFRQINEEELAKKVPEKITLTVTLKDGSVKEVSGESWRTRPYDLAREHVSKSWAESLIVSKVNGKQWDLNRPLEGPATVEFVTFDSFEGKQVFWHSTAHIMGEAVERLYGGHLCYGPPIENGFYYDVYMTDAAKKVVASNNEAGEKDSTGISINHFDSIQSLMKKITGERQPFERLELTKAQLLEMFAYNQFKVRILNEKVKEERTTVYRCGTLIDLCLGPHVRDTGFVKAFKLTKTSSSFWEGKSDAETLQRVYGISFPEPKLLKEWERFQEEAAKRDHRKLGREQGLFFFHHLSPGSCFFTPRGAHIYNSLMNFIRSEYRVRGFSEVITPNIFNTKLWETSGHWKHYAENMFSFEIEKEQFALKPMNCPSHCLIFESSVRSWRDLPLRLADFGVLHRNEISGALTGLTRVRRFQQDDAHIFCRPEQIEQEVTAAFDFMKKVYTVFGFTFDMVLSTRPEKFLGDPAEWDKAEAALASALDKFGEPWERNEGDGAFYGPKIDITVKDALRRPYQCATIQLDFQMPNQFELHYTADSGAKMKPVIIHRAIFGSLERFIAIITENFGGKWPFWLSPMQAIVLPIGPNQLEYAQKVKEKVWSAGFQVDIEDDASLTINKKVRTAQTQQYNFILVVGEKEATNGTVNVRTRDNRIHGERSVDDLIARFKKLAESKTLNAEEEFDSVEGENKSNNQ